MDLKALKTLEFYKVLDILKQFASSSKAREKIENIVPSEDIVTAERLLAETAEADRVLFEFATDPNFAVDDITLSLDRAKKMSVLTMGELLKVSCVLRVGRVLKQTIARVPELSVITDFSNELFTNHALEERIDKSIISDSEMSDDASPELRALRVKIRRCNDNVKTKLNSYISASQYQKYLQDNLITMRSDRYVIPVKSEYKGQISGLVHDQSSSGATLYIEPMAIVELNNELKQLILSEQLEIERILRELTAGVAADVVEISSNFEIITNLDVIFARAKLARKLHASCPKINSNGYVNIINGRHPLIDKDKVKPISIYFGRDFDIMLITGPNAGGKTVTLKLVGLCQLMGLSGMFIPSSSGSEISIFDNIFCDIGDEQSIEQSLSTFSGHMTNIISFIDRITNNSLLLLDELGAGTDPSEGSALAVAITKYIKKIGSKAVITSHFNDLKEFAISTKRVGSASMDFNIKTFEPTYRLLIGISGASNALQIAKRLGLKSEIIEVAESFLSDETKNFERVLMSAEVARKQAEELIEQSKTNKLLAETELKNIQIELARLRENNDKLNEQIRKETKKLIEQSVDEANDILDEMKDLLKQSDMESLFEARRLKKKLENMSANYSEPDDIGKMDNSLIYDDTAIVPGDEIYIKSLDKVGKVLFVGKKDEYEVALGSVKTQIKAIDCKKIVTINKKPPQFNVSKTFSNASAKSELNLIGKNVDEALYELDEYLYNSVSGNLSEVRIVHGKGTGILRQAVQKFLAKHSTVLEFRDGLYGEGDRGVTIVKLK
ncbi:MAG: endonuclease MutS2 [Clostridia bacterium]